MTSTQPKAAPKTAPGESHPVKFVKPPATWKAKVAEGRGRDLDAIKRQADLAMQQMLGEYLVHARDALAKIDTALATAKSAAGKEREAALHTILMVTHEIRNEAGTLGYDMLTKIGASLCDYIADVKNVDDVKLKAIAIHADAMRLVISDDMAGDGGKAGQALFAGIEKLVSKTSGA